MGGNHAWDGELGVQNVAVKFPAICVERQKKTQLRGKNLPKNPLPAFSSNNMLTKAAGFFFVDETKTVREIVLWRERKLNFCPVNYKTVSKMNQRLKH